jgi:hypothetical protein
LWFALSWLPIVMNDIYRFLSLLWLSTFKLHS